MRFSRAIIFPEHDPLRRAAPLVVGLVAALVYANALANGFVFDDKEIIQRNEVVHSLRGLWLAWVLPYWPPPLDIGQYRPLVTTSYVVDWALSGGSPLWFHLVNVLWHVAATLATWRLARELLSPAGALAAGVLFAVHSVHVEAVANTVGRAELMATFFVVAALIAHHRAAPPAEGSKPGDDPRGPLARWAAPALFALGLASKENAITFLALAPAMDLLASRRPLQALRERRALYLAYGAVAVLYAVVLALVFRGKALVMVAPVFWNVEAGPRVLTALSLIPHFVRLLVFPLDLSSDYSPRIVNLAESVTPLVAAGVLLIGAVVGAIGAAWRRAPVAALGLFWIVATLAPVSNLLFASGIALAERTLYLPSVGAMIVVGWLLERLAERRFRAAVAIAASAAVLLAARTWSRTPTWVDSRTWLATLLEDHPESYKAHFYYAQLLEALQRHPEADVEFTRALQLFQRDPYAYQAAGYNAAMLRQYPRALALLDTAVALHPGLASAHYKRADMRLVLGDYAGAIESARMALALPADSATRASAAMIEAVARQRSSPPR